MAREKANGVANFGFGGSPLPADIVIDPYSGHISANEDNEEEDTTMRGGDKPSSEIKMFGFREGQEYTNMSNKRKARDFESNLV